MFERHRRLVRLALVALSLTGLAGVVAAYGYAVSGRGCPSAAELEHPFTTREVWPL